MYVNLELLSNEHIVPVTMWHGTVSNLPRPAANLAGQKQYLLNINKIHISNKNLEEILLYD